MVNMSGGQAVVNTLIALGARRGFGVPGESFLAVLDAFYDVSDFTFTAAAMKAARLLWRRPGRN